MADKSAPFDVIIIGGGPAGLSALMWCRDLGLRALVLEEALRAGGQLHRIHNPVNNYPGLSAGTGTEFFKAFTANIPNLEVDILFGQAVSEIDPSDLSVITSDGSRVAGKAIVFAAGVRRRKLRVPGENEFIGRGIMESGSKEKLSASDKIVAIIGGGDAALENAVILAEVAKKVIVIFRREGLTARSSFVETAKKCDNVEFLAETIVTAIRGRAKVEELCLADVGSGRESLLGVDLLLVRIGVEPNSELLKGKVELDAAGYVQTDIAGRTSIPNIYAAGDVANHTSPTIISAAGSGASAIKAILQDIFETH